MWMSRSLKLDEVLVLNIGWWEKLYKKLCNLSSSPSWRPVPKFWISLLKIIDVDSGCCFGEQDSSQKIRNAKTDYW